MLEFGAVIAAASRRVAQPFAKVGGLSFIQRLMLTFHKAGVRSIVVVTGFEDPELKAALAHEGVTFVPLADYEDPELIESFRIGLERLRDTCDRVFLTPVNAPLFRFDTLRTMQLEPGAFVVPSFRGRAGHPVLVDRSAIGSVFDYAGPDGLAGLIRTSPLERRWVDVNDEGVLVSAKDLTGIDRLLPAHDESLLQASVSLSIRKAAVVFDARTLQLLRQIDETHSVSGACRSLALSLTRAWRLINELEDDLGFRVVNRSQGGHHGGKTRLSDEGRVLVQAYSEYAAAVQDAASRGFETFHDRIAPLVNRGERPDR